MFLILERKGCHFLKPAIAILLLVSVRAGQTRIISDVRPAEPTEVVKIVFPAEDRIYFSIPITLVVFHLTEPAKLAGVTAEELEIEIDGRLVPQSAIGRAHILTGRNSAIFSTRVQWAVTEGGHSVVIRSKQDEKEWISRTGYVIETSHPSTSGLSGFIQFPSNEAIFSRSARAGFSFGSRRTVGNAMWFNLAPLQFHRQARLLPIPLETGVSHHFSGARNGTTYASWKLEPIAQDGARPGLGIGQSEGNLFAVIGWHSNPNRFQGSIGVGGGSLATGFLGFAYSPSFFRLMFEGNSRRRINYGLSLTHPRGIRFSIYNIQSGIQGHATLFQLSMSRGL